MHEDDREIGRWVDEQLATRLPEENWQPNASRGFARLLSEGTPRPRRRTWAWAAIGVMATSLSLAAFPATRSFAQRCLSVCVRQSSQIRQFFMDGARDVAPTNVFVKPGERELAPDFVLSDATGQTIKLSDLRGKVVLVNFWATWCVPCKVEIPYLVEFQRIYGDRGFAVLGISLDEDGWNSVKPYMNEKRMNYRVMIGNADVARSYGGLQTVPTTLIIDKSGRIAACHLGLCRRGEYEADIQAVLSE